MNDLPIAPLFGSFTSPCKVAAKEKDEQGQSFFILERNVYNSFNTSMSKLMIPCTYTTSNGRHSAVAESTKSSAVFTVAGELFVGTSLVQIICSEIEWSFPNAVTQKGEKNTRTPKRENLLKFEQQIVNKKLKANSTLPTRLMSSSTLSTSSLSPSTSNSTPSEESK